MKQWIGRKGATHPSAVPDLPRFSDPPPGNRGCPGISPSLEESPQEAKADPLGKRLRPLRETGLV